MTILVVEDNSDDVLLLKRMLDRMSPELTLHIVKDGVETLEYLTGTGAFADRQAHPLPALILLDIRMPRMTGLEVLEWLRCHPGLKDIPVVILTDSDSKEHFGKASELKVNSYLAKSPVMQRPQVLKEVIDQWCVQRNPCDLRPRA